ncbi:MAG TPA: hypothetical protein VJQ51_03370 [Burkholderiales bacterium]|nr:hypothetical protein [Burkholderiales bacterium]
MEEIHSREEAHRVVEQIAARKVENNPTVKAWRAAEDYTWLILLAGALVLFYLIYALTEVFRLV